MKNLTFVFILFLSFSTFAQEHTEVIKKELQFDKRSDDNLLIINNVNGNITVEGYNGSTILIEVEKMIKGKNQRKLAQGKEEVQVGVHEEGNDILVYMKTPCTDVKSKMDDDGKWHWRTWKNNCNWGNGIHFNLDYVIKVPFDTNIELSTVNDGEIVVKDVSGKVDANNINGGISLQQISGKTHAHSINGDVDIKYSKNPTEDSRYYSLNGDINAYYQKGLAATMTFESFNGDFFTNLDDVTMLPTVIQKIKVKDKGKKKYKNKKKNKNKGIKYKIGGKSKMQVRDGEVLLDFETFNGNVYIKEY